MTTPALSHPTGSPKTRSAGVAPGWLALREPSDAAARAAELVPMIPLPQEPGERLVVHDLGCGTGSMTRWLAPRLPGPQHWVLYDRDAALLALAAGTTCGLADDGSPVSVHTRRRDITGLTGADLAGATLVTTSALLDLLTAEELSRLADACCAARCPALLTLSVVGQVALTPAESLDDAIMDAFNDHQRRRLGGRRLLGPDAAEAAAEAFTRRGADVVLRPSPWVLGADTSALAWEWFTGWIGAAIEQRPELAVAVQDYARRRRAAALAGTLEVTVQHVDLLVRP